MPVTIRSEAADSIAVRSHAAALDRSVAASAPDRRRWTASEERLPWTTDTIVVGGTIASNLYDAIDASAKDDLPAGARQQLAWSLADVYEYRVDMSRDLQEGDEFKVVAERRVAPTGAVRIGKVIAATFKLSGTRHRRRALRQQSASGDFFDQNGKSMRAAFLRAPLEFRRISSVFGMREHPILGGMRAAQGHGLRGRDAARRCAPSATAWSCAQGWGNGYGNVLEIRHRNGFVTRYGHLSRFSPAFTSDRASPSARRSRTSGAPGSAPGRTCTSRCW